MLALSLVGVFAIGPAPVQWAKGYSFGESESHPHAGVQTTDGGFLMVGGACLSNTTLTKLLAQNLSSHSTFCSTLNVLLAPHHLGRRQTEWAVTPL